MNNCGDPLFDQPVPKTLASELGRKEVGASVSMIQALRYGWEPSDDFVMVIRFLRKYLNNGVIAVERMTADGCCTEPIADVPFDRPTQETYRQHKGDIILCS